MLSRFCLTAALGAVFIQFLPEGHTAVRAQEYEGCFMVNSSGQVVNLTRMCAPQDESASNPATDLAFIENYKRLVMSYPPQTKDNLLKGIESSPKDKIATAKKICDAARSGTSLAEWRLKTLNNARQIENPAARDSFMAEMELIISIAPNYYCPNLANK